MGSAYDKESESYKTIQKIYDTYYLVNIVDNDYTNEDSDIFSIFRSVIIERMDKDQLRNRLLDVEKEGEKLREHIAMLRAMQKETDSELEKVNRHLGELQLENAALKSENRKMQL